jgi:hypothetical protein
VRWGYHVATASKRALPEAIIIGAQRSGTSSLFAYLAGQPSLVPPLKKEIHYFDFHWHRGLAWYQAHFPTARSLDRLGSERGLRAMTFEASPYYLAHPLTPYRVRGSLPDVKVIALLRDPVKRAVSHHAHAMRKGWESLPFDEAIEREADRLDGERARLRSEPFYRSHAHQHHSYLARGRYAEQLQAWFALFPVGNLLVLDSGALFRDPPATVAHVCAFLGVPFEEAPQYPAVRAGDYPPVNGAVRERLRGYFAEHNRRLWTLIGQDFGWD